MDRIDSVAVFAEVAERGSFVGAAKHLNRSAAAVTRAVAELEARLGVRLLNRTTRAVSVTEAGQRFLAGARRVLADLAEIEQGAAGQGQAPRGELRVTAPIVFGRRHVLPLVTDFLAQYPEVSVRLALLDRPVDLVEDGLDVAVRIGKLADSSAIAVRVGAMRRVVVAAPGYLKSRGRPAAPADLAGHDVIAFAGMDRVDRWRFANGVGGQDQAAADREHRGGRDRCGGRGFRHHPGAELPGGRCAVRAVAGAADAASTKPARLRFTWSIRKAAIRRPSSAPFVDALVPRLRQRCGAIARSLDS